jgi:hypothetical protein
MKNASLALVAAALVTVGTACGITPEKFAEDFVPLYCDAWDSCVTSGRPCPVTLEEAAFESPDCNFDKAAARDCLASDYTCDETVPGFEVVVTPDACLADRICGL